MSKKTIVEMTIVVKIKESDNGLLDSHCTVELSGKIKLGHGKRVNELALSHIDREVKKAIYKIENFD